jgi:hypothetical protein
VLTRHLRLLVAVATIPLCSGCGVYLGLGPSWVPYQGHSFHAGSEFQLGYSPPEFPHWAVAFAANGASATDSSSFREPTCYTGTLAEVNAGKAAGCHPRIYQSSGALAVQYRWHTDRRASPVASVAFGRSQAHYAYRVAERLANQDSLKTSSTMTLRGGGEFGLSRWAHVNVMAGYQAAFRDISLQGPGSNSGFTLTSMLVFGRRYRTPVSDAKPVK